MIFLLIKNEKRDEMKKKKMLAILIGTLILSGCSGSNLGTTGNKHGGTKIVNQKDGIELTLELDKSSYTSTEKITINAKAKNVSKKDIKFTAGNGCFNGFNYNLSKAFGRLYDIERDGSAREMCTMAVEERIFKKDEETKMKLEIKPQEFMDDRHLYPEEELELSVSFLGVVIPVTLPVKIEAKERKKNIPSSAEEAAQLHLNNETIKQWMTQDPLNRIELAVGSVYEADSVWVIEYTINGPKSPTINVEVESDTGKIITASFNTWYLEEVIIPRMVLRTSFENELKNNPNKTYKVTVHSNDFQKELNDELPDGNEEEKSKKHIENIESYNGKIIDYSKWVYTYTIKMKGKDILEMANSGEWEYIRPGGLLD